jgi:hypothetical protein
MHRLSHSHECIRNPHCIEVISRKNAYPLFALILLDKYVSIYL